MNSKPFLFLNEISVLTQCASLEVMPKYKPCNVKHDSVYLFHHNNYNLIIAKFLAQFWGTNVHKFIIK